MSITKQIFYSEVFPKGGGYRAKNWGWGGNNKKYLKIDRSYIFLLKFKGFFCTKTFVKKVPQKILKMVEPPYKKNIYLLFFFSKSIPKDSSSKPKDTFKQAAF